MVLPKLALSVFPHPVPVLSSREREAGSSGALCVTARSSQLEVSTGRCFPNPLEAIM